ncbi:uncharacterized protein LOC141912658 [Tubulanus polymorphus]|uniref:uncharacterized protein LOC141912658 n=1 Tax=Tubulanus polymorphus TaxID=672921 RepID=UPI003DA3C012
MEPTEVTSELKIGKEIPTNFEPEPIEVTDIIDGVINELTEVREIPTNFKPDLLTSLPGKQKGEQSRVIFTQWESDKGLYFIDDNNEMKKYVIKCDQILGLAADSNGYLFLFVLKGSRYYLRKYRDQTLLIEEDISDLWSRCKTLVIRGDNIYLHSDGREIHVVPLLKNSGNVKLIDRGQLKNDQQGNNNHQLPLFEESYYNKCFDVDSNGRMFVYCRSKNELLYPKLLYLTADAKEVDSIYMKDCGLTFDPQFGYPCVINDKHVFLSVNSGTDNGGRSVISIGYNDEGFKDHPRIVFNSADSDIGEIHQVCDSNTVVIRHYEIINKKHSLRVYSINTAPAAVIKWNTVPAPAVRGSTETASTEKENRYNMNHKHRGLAIIISNEEFKHATEGSGTEFGDVKSLLNVFSGLGFDVKVYMNQWAKEMKSIMDEAAKHDIHRESDAFVCAILSHGADGAFLGTDGETVRIDDLLAPFKGDVCEALAGKPKLFFTKVPYCGRTGELYDSAVDVDVDGRSQIPTEADFLIASATVPGYVSWRNTQTGSWFIQALCEVLKEHYTKLDLVKILTRVNRKVAYEYGTNNPKNKEMHEKKQMPLIYSTLTKELYFTQ